MYNRAWCKSYISAVRHGQNQKGYRIFLSGPGGTGKSHVVHLVQRDMSYFFKHTVKPDDDQPIVLITAPTGSAAFQMGGSTIHSAFLLHDNYKSKPSWEKRSKIQIKLEHVMLSITDEMSMVGFKQFQSMNEIMCTFKGTTDGNWGDICVLAVGDLYQLPPVAHCPIYMSPQTVHTLNDIAPNGWEQMQLHELTQSMRQKDIHINIGNFKTKIADIQNDDIFHNADIIALNETHLQHTDTLTLDMIGLSQDRLIVQCNNRGCGFVLVINRNLNPKHIRMETILEIVVVQINVPMQIIVISVYRPPSTPLDVFINGMLEVIAQFQNVPTCLVSDLNEDVSITSNTHSCTMFKLQGLQQMIKKPTHNSGTIIDHVYVSHTLNTIKQMSQTAITVIMILYYVF